MKEILFLYDLKDKALARDFQDLLETLCGPLTLIPLKPGMGLTLEGKEDYYFKNARAAIFLLTPGCDRYDLKFPSPSVSVEIGRAKEKFEPDKVIHLMEEGCNNPTISQKSYITFNRKDIGAILEAITQLVRELKSTGLILPKKETEKPKIFINEEFVKRIDQKQMTVLNYVSTRKDSWVEDAELNTHMMNSMGLSVQEMNFLKSDLKSSGLITYHWSVKAYWQLQQAGLDAVRIYTQQVKSTPTVATRLLLRDLAKREKKS